jgi:C4-dicarboxylate transporter DctM subunit
MLIGVHIAYALGFSSILFGYLAYGEISLNKIGWATFHLLYNLSWTPLPLFVLLACILAETSIGEDLYRAASRWLSRIPGGLIVASIMGEAAMAAAVGASGPCILSVGKVAEPEFERYGYKKTLGLGALTAGGVLGPLIPPSATMIIYSVLSNVSLGHLFMAGMVPGILLALMLSMVPIILCTRNPSLGPATGTVTWAERFSSLRKMWPIVIVMIFILGSIYFGIATPTEAGGVGCFVVIIMAIVFFGLRSEGLIRAMKEAVLINAMMLIVIIGATFFSYVVGSSGLAKELAVVVTSFEISPILVIICIMIILLILGCFIDGITIMLLTIPIFLPIIIELGFDPIWFGVLFVTNMEIALITPPMGMNLFLVKAAFDVRTSELIKGVLPFILVLFLFLFVLVAFPELSLWLPGMMKGH